MLQTESISCGEMSERFKEPVLKTGDSREGAVGSNPTLSAIFFLLTEYLVRHIRRSTQVGRRGAPAKGVGRD